MRKASPILHHDAGAVRCKWSALRILMTDAEVARIAAVHAAACAPMAPTGVVVIATPKRRWWRESRRRCVGCADGEATVGDGAVRVPTHRAARRHPHRRRTTRPHVPKLSNRKVVATALRAEGARRDVQRALGDHRAPLVVVVGSDAVCHAPPLLRQLTAITGRDCPPARVRHRERRRRRRRRHGQWRVRERRPKR